MDPKTCLLIDDDIDDHEIFALALAETSKQVRLVSEFDSVGALNRLCNTDELPNVIFLDLNMPRMDGKQFLFQIKQKDRLSEIPVIIYSTSSEIRDLLDTRDLGASAYIVKSNSISELSAALADFFDSFPP